MNQPGREHNPLGNAVGHPRSESHQQEPGRLGAYFVCRLIDHRQWWIYERCPFRVIETDHCHIIRDPESSLQRA